MRVTGAVGFQANRDYGMVSGERNCALGPSEHKGRGSMDGGQGLLGVGRGRGTQQHAGEGERADR